MDTTQFDNDIEDAKAQKEAVMTKLESLVEEYIDTTVRLLGIESPAMIEATVANNPAITEKLGLEKLRELKGKVKDVLTKLPALTREHLNSNEIWEHRQAVPMANLSIVRDELTNKVDGALRQIIGYLGELIVKYGYSRAGGGPNWNVQMNKPPLYTGREFQQTFAEYRKMKTQYQQLMRTLVDSHQDVARLQQVKERAIAKDLWDQA